MLYHSGFNGHQTRWDSCPPLWSLAILLRMATLQVTWNLTEDPKRKFVFYKTPVRFHVNWEGMARASNSALGPARYASRSPGYGMVITLVAGASDKPGTMTSPCNWCCVLI